MTEPRPTSASLVRARVRRTAYAFFHLNDGGFLDIAGLLAGRVRIKRMRHVCAISILKGEEAPMSLADLRLLFRISSDGWTSVDELAGRQGLTVARIRQFADRGLVVTDEPTGDMKEMLRRDE